MEIRKKAATASFCFMLTLLQFGWGTAQVYASDISALDSAAIQTRIDKSQPGDRLVIQPGIYRGSIHVDKPIHLIATGTVVIDGRGQNDVITLTADHVDLRGFTIRNSGTSLEKDQAGIRILSSYNQILNNRIEHCLHGIYLHESMQNRIERNQIVGIQEKGINDRGNGIHLIHSSENVMDDNQIIGTRDGMYFSTSDHNRADHNQVRNVRYGLHYMYSNYNSFEGNSFTDNVGGSALMYSHDITLSHNRFTEHRGQLGTAVLFNACDDSRVEFNTIEGNTRAIYMDSSSRNVISNNRILNNLLGIELPSSNSDNRIFGNTWIANDTTVVMDHDKDSNIWYNPDTKRGNYWQGAQLLDLNGDGVSDLRYHPMSVQGYLISQYPDLRFLIHSPAMKLLDFAYQQIPIFEIPGPTDPYPLIHPAA